MLICLYRSRPKAATQPLVKPKRQPTPAAIIAVPAKAADTGVVVASALVDSSPEAHLPTAPFNGDEVGVREQKVQQIGIKDRGVRKLFTKRVAGCPPIPVVVVLRARKVERDLGGIPFEVAALPVLRYAKRLWDQRVCIEINYVTAGHGKLPRPPSRRRTSARGGGATADLP